MGLEISQLALGIKVHQSKYDSDIINQFKIKYCKQINTPFLSRVKLEEANSTLLENNTMYKQLVGCLIYLTHTRPNISYAVSVEYKNMVHTHDIH